MTARPSTWYADPSGGDRVLDLRLELLDRQLVGPEGRLLGKVDDLELTEAPDGALYVTALLSGPLALGPRLGGRVGAWVVAIARRLSLDPDPAPLRIAMSQVTDLGSAVTVAFPAHEGSVAALERWLDVHVISRIPGSSHESQ
jgi:hypothetical protein